MNSPHNQRSVYLDYGATTPMHPDVHAVMQPFYSDLFANASALYASAVNARTAIDTAREVIGSFLHTTQDTIIFTSGGTESNNLAISGVLRKHKGHGKHIITTPIEHMSVLGTIRHYEELGFEVTMLRVDDEGLVSIDALKAALRPDTVLVSVMYANNEIGTVQPIAELGKEIMKWRTANTTPYPYFHTDACQATNYLPMSVEKLHVDLLTLNGSKIYGPKGSGVLYKRRNVEITPLFYGGGQENELRSGTEDVASIVGIGMAIQMIDQHKEQEIKQTKELRDYLWQRIQKEIPDVLLNGPHIDNSEPKERSLTYKEETQRLPNNLNISFLGAEAEAIILYLDAKGIMCSSGSACSTDSEEVSHVLTACGHSADRARSSIRFTLGKFTTKEDIDYVMTHLPAIIEKIRAMHRID